MALVAGGRGHGRAGGRGAGVGAGRNFFFFKMEGTAICTLVRMS